LAGLRKASSHMSFSDLQRFWLGWEIGSEQWRLLSLPGIIL